MDNSYNGDQIPISKSGKSQLFMNTHTSIHSLVLLTTLMAQELFKMEEHLLLNQLLTTGGVMIQRQISHTLQLSKLQLSQLDNSLKPKVIIQSGMQMMESGKILITLKQWDLVQHGLILTELDKITTRISQQ
jgi:hypothetical protein